MYAKNRTCFVGGGVVGSSVRTIACAILLREADQPDAKSTVEDGKRDCRVGGLTLLGMNIHWFGSIKAVAAVARIRCKGWQKQLPFEKLWRSESVGETGQHPRHGKKHPTGHPPAFTSEKCEDRGSSRIHKSNHETRSQDITHRGAR